MFEFVKPGLVEARKWGGTGSRVLLGLIFVAAGVGKMLTQGDPTKMLFNPFPDYMTATFNAAIFTWLPRVELCIGILLILGIIVKPMAVLSAALALSFIVNNSYLLMKGLGYEPCTCFGILDSWLKAERSTTGSLFLDIVMLSMALIVIFWSKSGHLSVHLRRWTVNKQLAGATDMTNPGSALTNKVR